MEVRYRNDRADFIASVEWRLRDRKPRARSEFYEKNGVFCLIMGMAAISSGISQHYALTVIFAFYGLRTLWINRSFSRHWQVQVDSAADIYIETETTLQLDDSGLTESFLGCSCHVAWDQIDEFGVIDGRLHVVYLRADAVVVPLGGLSEVAGAALVATLLRHGVREADSPPPVR